MLVDALRAMKYFLAITLYFTECIIIVLFLNEVGEDGRKEGLARNFGACWGKIFSNPCVKVNKVSLWHNSLALQVVTDIKTKHSCGVIKFIDVAMSARMMCSR